MLKHSKFHENSQDRTKHGSKHVLNFLTSKLKAKFLKNKKKDGHAWDERATNSNNIFEKNN